MEGKTMSERPDLFQQMQALFAGHSEAAVMRASLQSLLAVIGVSAPGLGRAEAMIDALPAELKPLLRRDWPKYRAHRGNAENQQDH
jgi:hypothetical protein